MKQITQTGATVEEALQLALQKLGSTREQVDVEVLQEGKKGFLGFGARQAEVRVSVKEVKEVISQPETKIVEEVQKAEENSVEEDVIEKAQTNNEITEQVYEEQVQEKQEDPIEAAKNYLVNIAKELDIHDLKIEIESEGSKNILFKLESEKAALLIGKRGATLNALQQLTQLVINKTAQSFMLVKLDVENYRERRQQSLEQLAERMADRAVRSGKKVSLEPMPSYERKVIHNALANRIDIETHSEGIEPNRYLVIEPLK